MTSIIITLLVVFYRVPLINILGDMTMGYYSTALVIYLILMTLTAHGLPKAVALLVSEQNAKGQYSLAYKTAKASLIFSAAAGGVLTTAMFLSADFFANTVMNASNSALAIKAFAPCVLFISVLGAFHGIYSATKATQVSKIAHWIEELCVVISSIAFAYYFHRTAALEDQIPFGAMSAALGITTGVFMACVFMLYFYRKHSKKLYRFSLKDETQHKDTYYQLVRKIVVTMLPFALTLVVYHFSSFIDYAIFNRIMRVQGMKEADYMSLLGIFNGKYEFFISIPLLAVSWIAASKVPMLSKIGEYGTRRKINVRIGQLLRYTMLYIIPCTAIFILYARPLMDLFFIGNNDTSAVMLRIGAVSMFFYSLAVISNAALNALERWNIVTKNACISLVVQVIALLIMLVIFQWNIYALVFSRIIFSAALFVLNEHTLREATGYIQEKKRTFKIPFTSVLIMSGVTFVLYFILEIFMDAKVALLFVFPAAFVVYVTSLIFLGGITQREMYLLPGGKYLAPLCRKLHLIK